MEEKGGRKFAGSSARSPMVERLAFVFYFGAAWEGAPRSACIYCSALFSLTALISAHHMLCLCSFFPQNLTWFRRTSPKFVFLFQLAFALCFLPWVLISALQGLAWHFLSLLMTSDISNNYPSFLSWSTQALSCCMFLRFLIHHFADCKAEIPRLRRRGLRPWWLCNLGEGMRILSPLHWRLSFRWFLSGASG